MILLIENMPNIIDITGTLIYVSRYILFIPSSLDEQYFVIKSNSDIKTNLITTY